jgi:hypothetical protein
MSAKKLKIHQKVFLLLERLIAETGVKSLSLSMISGALVLKTAIPCVVNNSGLFQEGIEVKSEDLFHRLEIHGMMNNFKTVKVQQLSFDFLNVVSGCCELEGIRKVLVKRWDFLWNARIFDIFKRFAVSRSLSYKTMVNSLSVKINTILYRIKFRIHSEVRDNCTIIKRLHIKRSPLQLTAVPENTQLQYWKKLLLETKQHPQEFQLVGIYSLIPFNVIKNIKIDFITGKLRFRVDHGSLKKAQYSDIAIFQEIDSQKAVLIKW